MQTSKKQRREFALSLNELKTPYQKLLAWIEHNIDSIDKTPIKKLLNYIERFEFFYKLIALILGSITAIGLLSYNGKNPVNVMYILFVVIVLPLFTIMITFLSGNSLLNSLQKIFLHTKLEYIDTKLVKAYLLKNTQLFSLLFYVAFLLSFIMIVLTKDIAFVWSSTVDIAPQDFYNILKLFAYPWIKLFPQAMPSLQLIHDSQYFRLGNYIHHDMITHAKYLGKWWKYIVASTLFYAIFLRFLTYLFFNFRYKAELKKALLRIDGVSELLKDMDEPYIQKSSIMIEKTKTTKTIPSKTASLQPNYDIIYAWGWTNSQINLLADTLNIQANKKQELGIISYDAEQKLINTTKGIVLLLVKSWEPPTMEILDLIQTISQKADKLDIYPLGLETNDLKPKQKDTKIWIEKISQTNLENVRIIHD